MLDVLTAAALLAATMTTGIGAGVFQLYNFAIMPGLGKTSRLPNGSSAGGPLRSRGKAARLSWPNSAHLSARRLG